MYYKVVLLLINDAYEKGMNPPFYFKEKDEFLKFMFTCFDNGYDLEVSEITEECFEKEHTPD